MEKTLQIYTVKVQRKCSKTKSLCKLYFRCSTCSSVAKCRQKKSPSRSPDIGENWDTVKSCSFCSGRKYLRWEWWTCKLPYSYSYSYPWAVWQPLEFVMLKFVLVGDNIVSVLKHKGMFFASQNHLVFSPKLTWFSYDSCFQSKHHLVFSPSICYSNFLVIWSVMRFS